MKAIIILVFAAIFFFSVAASAAEYVIREGDTLSGIALKLEHSTAQLGKMNELKDKNRIIAGNKLVYLSSCDLRYAKKWCEKRIRELCPVDPNRSHFKGVAEDIGARNIRYGDEYSGVHFSSVLVYAEAWRSRCRCSK